MRRSPERATSARAGLWLAILAAGLGLSAGFAGAADASAAPSNHNNNEKSVAAKPVKKLPASTFAKVMAGSNSTARILAPQGANNANVAGNAAANASNAPGNVAANANSNANANANPSKNGNPSNVAANNSNNSNNANNANVANANVVSSPASPVERQTIAPGTESEVVHTASAEATVLKVSTPANNASGEPKATLEESVNYQYNTLGRRDPFQSMIDGEFVGNDVGGAAPPDVGGLHVVGIVWGDGDKFALVEDGRGNSHVLRPGDKVMNGVVTELRRDAVVVSLTTDDQTQQVTIPLIRKGDKNDAR